MAQCWGLSSLLFFSGLIRQGVMYRSEKVWEGLGGHVHSLWWFYRQPPVAAATVKNQSRSPIKRRSGLFPRLHSGSEGQGDSRTRW